MYFILGGYASVWEKTSHDIFFVHTAVERAMPFEEARWVWLAHQNLKFLKHYIFFPVKKPSMMQAWENIPLKN